MDDDGDNFRPAGQRDENITPARPAGQPIPLPEDPEPEQVDPLEQRVNQLEQRVDNLERLLGDRRRPYSEPRPGGEGPYG
jgi:hypothetical protein